MVYFWTSHLGNTRTFNWHGRLSLHGQTGRFMVWVNGSQSSGLVNFAPESRWPFVQISWRSVCFKMHFQKWSIWSDNLSCHNLYTLTVTWKCMLTSIRNVKFLWKCESSQCWAPLFVFYFLLICHYYPAPSLLLSSFKSLLAGWILITNLSSSHPVITPTLPQDWSGIHLSLCARH